MNRREFLKLLGLASVTALGSSCEEEYHWLEAKPKKIISSPLPPEDGVVPGEAVHYPSTCTECPANCGVLVKIREGNPIKLEGNPEHPVNRGGLCIRGQSSLLRLYHPERLTGPVRKDKNVFSQVGWDQAYLDIAKSLDQACKSGLRNFYLGGRSTGTVSEIISLFCEKMGVEKLPDFEPYPHAALRDAYDRLFGQKDLPGYLIEKSDFLLTIGADILETFVSPVSYASQFARALQNPDWRWVHAEPHLTLTGLKATQRLVIRPTSEVYLLAFLWGQIKDGARKEIAQKIVQSIPVPGIEDTARYTGIGKEELENLSRMLKNARHPLLIVGNTATAHHSGMEVAFLSGLIQWVMGMTDETVNFSMSENFSGVGTWLDMLKLNDTLAGGQAGVVFFSRTNPAAYFPKVHSFDENLAKARMRVGIGDFLDETMKQCDLVLPLDHYIESIGDAEPRRGIRSLIGPVIRVVDEKIKSTKKFEETIGRIVRPIHDTRCEGDILLDLMKQKYPKDQDIPANFEQYLFGKWSKIEEKKQVLGLLRTQFLGKGYCEEGKPAIELKLQEEKAISLLDKLNWTPKIKPGEVALVSTSIRSGDGRSEVLPLLEEIPDPLTTISYGRWVSISEKTAETHFVKDGDEMEITAANFRLALPVKVQPVLADDVVVVYGPKKAFHQLAVSPVGDIYTCVEDIKLSKTGGHVELPILSGSMTEDGRGIVSFKDSHPDHKNPNIPKTLYPKYEYKEYRWAMAIDLERCIGCGACIAACYIENNIPMVGEKLHTQGREMSWLHLEPYVKKLPGHGNTIRLLPMLCQHCDNAPCEAVCPVYAPHHTPEGLNAQVYNRCIGTRFCSNNCPYKVRRFNWFAYKRNEAFTRMLNPDVPVRMVGVMEKCTFCVQRIRIAKDHAKDLGRKVMDGEMSTACAGSCPVQAITFGNILDPDSRVYKLAHSTCVRRIYEESGIEPAVYYLEKKES